MYARTGFDLADVWGVPAVVVDRAKQLAAQVHEAKKVRYATCLGHATTRAQLRTDEASCAEHQQRVAVNRLAHKLIQVLERRVRARTLLRCRRRSTVQT